VPEVKAVGFTVASRSPTSRELSASNLLKTHTIPTRLYLNEGYDDITAFEAHAKGPYFKKFYKSIEAFAVEGPRLIDGIRLEKGHAPPQ
jgi:hypothetical protein